MEQKEDGGGVVILSCRVVFRAGIGIPLMTKTNLGLLNGEIRSLFLRNDVALPRAYLEGDVRARALS